MPSAYAWQDELDAALEETDAAKRNTLVATAQSVIDQRGRELVATTNRTPRQDEEIGALYQAMSRLKQMRH